MRRSAEGHRTTPRVAAATLLVVYTQRLDACRDFYAELGLALVEEQHGRGPVHYSAELAGGVVVELYPGQPERVTGRLRLGFTVAATQVLPAGEHKLTDPDGRVVMVTAVAERHLEGEDSKGFGPSSH